MEGTGSGGSRFVAVVPRVGAIVLAVILLVVSAATIGIISRNDSFETLREFEGTLTDDFALLLALINGSLGAAGWLIVMTIGVVIVEIIAIVLVLINVQGTAKLVLGILEILFSIAVILSYLATGVACAVYASAWGGPPDACPDPGNEGVKDICDSIPLTATLALQAGFSILQAGVFILITCLTIFSLVKSRTQST